MVNNLTFGIWSAGSWTRVDTFLSDTGSVAGAVWVDAALWPAVWRDSDVVWQTRAGSNLPGDVILALGERSTWRRITRINVLLNLHLCNWGLDLDTVTEGVSGVSRWTLADGVVVDHLTPGVVAAGAGARVHTLLVDAGRQLVTV